MSNPNREVRSLTLDDAEVRMIEAEDGRRMIRGYAAVFNARSEVMTTPKGRQFREIIKPGAFSKSLQGADVRALFNHDPGQILGRRGSGTLRLMEDERGLVYEIDPPDTTAARDLAISLERRDVTGSSFSFAATDDSWGTGEDGLPLREVRSAHVFDVGPVTFPAYLEASAAYRSLDAQEREPAIYVPSPDQIAALLRIRLAEIS